MGENVLLRVRPWIVSFRLLGLRRFLQRLLQQRQPLVDAGVLDGLLLQLPLGRRRALFCGLVLPHRDAPALTLLLLIGLTRLRRCGSIFNDLFVALCGSRSRGFCCLSRSSLTSPPLWKK